MTLKFVQPYGISVTSTSGPSARTGDSGGGAAAFLSIPQDGTRRARARQRTGAPSGENGRSPAARRSNRSPASGRSVSSASA